MAISVKHSGGVGSRFLGELEGSSGKRRAQQVPAAMSQMFQDSARDRQNQWQVYLQQQADVLRDERRKREGEAPRKMQVRRIEQDQLRLGERPQLRGASTLPSKRIEESQIKRGRPQPAPSPEQAPAQEVPKEVSAGTQPQQEAQPQPVRLNAVVRRKIREMESQYDNMVNEGKTSPEALKQIRENIDHWIRSAYVAEAQRRSFVDASEAQIAFEESIVENPVTGEKGLVDPKSGKFTPFTQDSPPKRTVEEIVKQDTYKDEEGNLWALDASGSPKIIKQATVKSEPSRPGYLTEEEIHARQKKRLEQVRNMTVTETGEDGVETERPATYEEMVAELNRLNEVDLALDTAAKSLSTYSYSGDGIAPGDPNYKPEEKKPQKETKRSPGISVQVTQEEADNPLIRDYMEEVNAAEESWDRERYNPKEATIADRNIHGFSSSWISDTSNMKNATREMKNDAIERREARVGIYGWILDEIKAEKERLDKKEQKEGKLDLGDDIKISKMRLLRDMLQPGNPLFKVDGTIEHKFVEQMKDDDKSKAEKRLIDEAVRSIESLMAAIMHKDTGATQDD
jgi:hypothetical protein